MFDGWTFGAGPIVELPTATNNTLGSSIWSVGPTVVGVRTAHPWIYGLPVNTALSLGGTSGRGGTQYALTTINPFLNYNFGGGWFIDTSMVTTATWVAAGKNGLCRLDCRAAG